MIPCSLDLVPWLAQGSGLPGFTFWFPGLGSMVALVKVPSCMDSLLAPWTCFHGYLVRVLDYLDSLPGSLDLVQLLPAEGSLLPGFSCWFPGLGSVVTWWRFLFDWIQFLVPSTWFLGFLAKVPGCLDSVLDSLVAWWRGPGYLGLVPDSLYFDKWLCGEGSWLSGCTSWFPGFGSMVAWWRFLVDWVHFLVTLTWFHACPV